MRTLSCAACLAMFTCLLCAWAAPFARAAEPIYETITPLAGDPFLLREGFTAIEPLEAVSGKALESWGGSGHMILLADGRLAVAYASSNRLRLTFSKDGGATWNAPRLIDAPLPDKGNTSRPNLIEVPGGPLWLFYYGWEKYTPTNPAESVNNLYAIHTSDDGATWSPPQRIYTGYVGMLQGAIRTSKGHMVVPLCSLTDSRRFTGLCLVSTDSGATWNTSNAIVVPDQPTTRPFAAGLSRGAIEPTVAELPDGRLFMLVRTIFGRLWQSESADGGLTWTVAMPSSLDCGGPCNMTRLPSGRLAMVWNRANHESVATQRLGTPIGYDSESIAVQADDGIGWRITPRFVKQIDGKNRVVHSMITGLPDGTLLLTMPGRSTLIKATESTLSK